MTDKYLEKKCPHCLAEAISKDVLEVIAKNPSVEGSMAVVANFRHAELVQEALSLVDQRIDLVLSDHVPPDSLFLADLHRVFEELAP